MNLDSPAALFSGLVIGTVGLGLFLYGKKAERPAPLAVGLGMCALPMLVHSLAAMWAITGASVAILWVAGKVT